MPCVRDTVTWFQLSGIDGDMDDNKSVWTNKVSLASRDYRRKIILGLYAMACDGRPQLFRIGVCGIRSEKNNADERLKQVNAGLLKHLGTWSYAFLAPIPSNLAKKAGACEVYYQSYMFKHFSYIGASHIDAPSKADVQDEATKCLLNLPNSMKFLDKVMPTFSTLAMEEVVKDWTAGWEA